MPPNNLPEPLQCARSWKYSEEWQQQYQDEHGADYVSKACEHSHAGFQIMFYICGMGEIALTQIKTQNLFIKRITSGKIDPGKVDENSLDWQKWTTFQDSKEALFEIYNAELAPADILSIIDEVGSFMDEGQKHCQAIFEYLEVARSAIQRREDSEDEARRAVSFQQNRNVEWKLVDERHSRTTDGFIYLLANALMPGVYKIGFSAGNPDKRAKEISLRYGLPASFELIEYWRTKDPYIIEQRIHSALAGYVKAGEFFEIDLNIAKATIQEHIAANQQGTS